MSNEALNTVLSHLVIPVVVIHDAATTPAVTDGLVVGGLPVAEVTFRTDAAPAAIESMAGDGRITVGAGTVINARQVDEAVSAGASFVVSPGLSREVVDRCRHHAIPVLPGAITPTEIMAGIDMGLDTFSQPAPSAVQPPSRRWKALSRTYVSSPPVGSSRTTSQISSPAPIFLPSEVPGSPRLMPSPPGTATPSPT